MASNVRSRRNTDIDISTLNNLERLIFSQCVWELGSNAWPDVSKLLSTHPLLLSRPKNFFNPRACSIIYASLMDQASLERSEANSTPRSAAHHKLAQIHYVARVSELKELIAAEEAKFKSIVAEIDEIRAGRWDDKIREKLGIKPPASVTTPVAVEEQHEAQLPHEDGIPAAESTTVEVDTAVQAEAPRPSPEVSAEPMPTSQQVSPEPELEVEEVVSPRPVEGAAATPSTPRRTTRSVSRAATSPHEAPDEAHISTDDSQIVHDMVMAGIGSDQPEYAAKEEAAPEKTEPEPEPIPSAQPSPEEEEEPERKPEAEAEREEEEEAPGDVEMEAAPSPEEYARADAKRKASETSLSDALREKKRPREDSEVAEEEEAAYAAGPSAGIRGRRRGQTTNEPPVVVSKRFQNVIGMLHSTISQHRYGNIFHNPIKKSEAPDYHDIVKRPMDLKTIKARVKDGLISNSLEFQRDVYLMFANAMMYNRPGSEICNMAEEMMLESEVHINAFRQTEGFHRM